MIGEELPFSNLSHFLYVYTSTQKGIRVNDTCMRAGLCAGLRKFNLCLSFFSSISNFVHHALKYCQLLISLPERKDNDIVKQKLNGLLFSDFIIFTSGIKKQLHLASNVFFIPRKCALSQSFYISDSGTEV